MTKKNLTFFQALKIAKKELAHEAIWFIEHICNNNFAKLIACKDTNLTDRQQLKFYQGIEQRKQGIPLAYILQSANFYGYDFFVNPKVLIPREDSAVLVNWVVDNLIKNNESKNQINILELGVGSGALLIVIAKKLQKRLPDIKIKYFATDVNQDVLDVANINFEKYKIKVSTSLGDWFNALSNQNQKYMFPKEFTIIYANPPYIALDDPHLLVDGILAEPKLALTDGKDGMSQIKRIIMGSQKYLANGGYLGIEHGWNQSENTREILKNSGFVDIESIKDNQENPRISFGKKVNIF